MKDPSCRRTEYFIPAFAIDGANGSRWMAADQDKENWIIADLGTAKRCTAVKSTLYVRRQDMPTCLKDLPMERYGKSVEDMKI